MQMMSRQDRPAAAAHETIGLLRRVRPLQGSEHRSGTKGQAEPARTGRGPIPCPLRRSPAVSKGR
jgi:hypothetical protein